MDLHNLEIGKVKIEYSTDGTILSGIFTPSMEIKLEERYLQQITELKSEKNAEVLKQNADTVLASWFNTINQIELSDREEYEIVSEIVSCEKYDNDIIKVCILKYIFKKK